MRERLMAQPVHFEARCVVYLRSRDGSGFGSCPALPEHCVFGRRVRRLDGLTARLGPSSFPTKF
jgi:hypothetical protein